MIKYKIKEGGKRKRTEYLIPTSWEEMTYDKYIQWINKVADNNFMQDSIAVLSFLSDVPADDLRRFPMTIVADISRLTGIFMDFEALNNYNIVPKTFEEINIAQMPWGLYEQAKMAVANCKGHYLGAGAEVVRIYSEGAQAKLQERIDKLESLPNRTAEQQKSLDALIVERDGYNVFRTIEQRPITESFALLNFFFHNCGLSRIALPA